MSDLRTAAQQALEALEHHGGNLPWNAFVEVRKDLRDALAQQADTTDPGHDVDVLREHVRHLERRVRQLHAQQAEPETCTWHQDGDSDSGVYATSCRHYFNLEDGTPEDNKMQWCCYCGKKLVQELITENDDE